MTPAMTFDAALLLKAQDIALFILDVDGVLTDGRLHYTDAGESIKAFNILDGHGIKLVQQCGVEVIIISGRKSAMVERRAHELGIHTVEQGVDNKLKMTERLLKVRGLTWQQAAAIGDDWPDAPLLVRAAFACAPANAHVEVKAVCHFVSQYNGGTGAVREVCDLLMMAKSRYREHYEAAFATELSRGDNS
jgi:3-deoxy-D-manno-octulosonate 8-phosphate phosphatase (KDO 8-P phosphatase)